MSPADKFLKEHRFWFPARGYDDRGLQNPGSLHSYLNELESNMNKVIANSDKRMQTWTQDMTGFFKRSKYTLDLTFHYVYRPHSGGFGLTKVVGSMFADPAQHFRLPLGNLQHLPASKHLFNMVLVAFALKVQSKIYRIRNEKTSNHRSRRP